MSKHPSKKVQVGEAKQKELDAVVRKLAQTRKVAVEAQLEKRLSYKNLLFTKHRKNSGFLAAFADSEWQKTLFPAAWLTPGACGTCNEFTIRRS